MLFQIDIKLAENAMDKLVEFESNVILDRYKT